MTQLRFFSDPPRLIGLSGYGGSGKDEAARHLVAKHGYNRIAFADKVRELALAVGGKQLREDTNRYGWEKVKREIPWVRDLLVDLGDGVRKVVGDDTWVDLAWQKVREGNRYVFSDVRKLNEAWRIRKDGGVVLRIEREGVGAANEFERALDKYEFDAVVANDGTVQELGEGLDAVLADLSSRNSLLKVA